MLNHFACQAAQSAAASFARLAVNHLILLQSGRWHWLSRPGKVSAEAVMAAAVATRINVEQSL
jgi:hypothetical protein